MFNNAWLYNRKTSRVYKYCSKLAEVFEQEIDPVMQSLGYCCGRKVGLEMWCFCFFVVVFFKKNLSLYLNCFVRSNCTKFNVNIPVYRHCICIQRKNSLNIVSQVLRVLKTAAGKLNLAFGIPAPCHVSHPMKSYFWQITKVIVPC